MKKHLAVILVVILAITSTSFRTAPQDENVLENITALATVEKKLGQTCTMGCHGLGYFSVCVMCGIQTTDPCTFKFMDEAWGDRSTCGAQED